MKSLTDHLFSYRWIHSACEYLNTEADIEKVLEKGYTCYLCRPKGATPPHLEINPPHPFSDLDVGLSFGRTRSEIEPVKVSFIIALTGVTKSMYFQSIQPSRGL